MEEIWKNEMEWYTGGHGRIKAWYTRVSMCVYFEEKLFAIFRNLKKKKTVKLFAPVASKSYLSIEILSLIKNFIRNFQVN